MRPGKRFRDWQERLREPSLSVVTVLEGLVLFVVGPLSETGLAPPHIIPFFVMLMALVSIFMVARDSFARVCIIIAFSATLGGAGLRTLFPSWMAFLFAETTAVLIFIATLSVVVGQIAFSGGRVTSHRLRGAIAIYLSIATAFGFLDNLIVAVWPDAYSNITGGSRDHLGQMIYFSLVTLTSTGYGDVAPVHPVARGLANLEAVIGQLYLAIMIASLVSQHVSHRRQAIADGGSASEANTVGDEGSIVAPPVVKAPQG
jgi:hypothetical protein